MYEWQHAEIVVLMIRSGHPLKRSTGPPLHADPCVAMPCTPSTRQVLPNTGIERHTILVLLEAWQNLMVLDNFSSSSPEALRRVGDLAPWPG